MSRLLAWVKAAVVEEKKKNTRHDSSWCVCVLSTLAAHMPHSVCTHACVCPPVCPCVQRVSRATSITLWLFIKALLPGNLVAWQREWGSPRGDLNQAKKKGEKTEGKRKGRTLWFHLELFYLSVCSPRGSTFTPRKICQAHLKSTVWQHPEELLVLIQGKQLRWV